MNKKFPLLPSGFYDLLPSDAACESRAVSQLLHVFSSFGFDQVSPPLMEFESSLFTGRGEEVGRQTFRISDPVSHEMMGIRADMTLQVGRIAVSRLASMPRPIRLCYAGQIVQSQPEPLRSERQLTQAGIELIGSDALRADAEVLIIATESLSAIGVKNISVDLNLSGLISELCPEAQNNHALQEKIKHAVLHKNAEMIAGLPVAASKTLVALMDAAGPIEKALPVLKRLNITQANDIEELVARVTKHCPGLKLTLDPLEYRGFDYHSGISFSLFTKGLRHELGRGGRYIVEEESATGFTLYVTHLLKLLPAMVKKKQVIVAKEAGADTIRALQAQEWVTVFALTNNLAEEAKLLGIGFLLDKKNNVTEIQ